MSYDSWRPDWDDRVWQSDCTRWEVIRSGPESFELYDGSTLLATYATAAEAILHGKRLAFTHRITSPTRRR